MAGDATLVLYLQGNYQASHELALRLHAAWSTSLGEVHPQILYAANNLARSLYGLGDYKAARALDQDTLARRRRVLGEDDPASLHTASNLARNLEALGDYQGAHALQQDTLTRRQRVLGDDHRDTIHNANRLGVTLQALGEYQRARALVKTASPAAAGSSAMTTPTLCTRPATSPSPCRPWATTRAPTPCSRTPWPATNGSSAATTLTRSARPTGSASPSQPGRLPGSRALDPDSLTAAAGFWAITTPTRSGWPPTSPLTFATLVKCMQPANCSTTPWTGCVGPSATITRARSTWLATSQHKTGRRQPQAAHILNMTDGARPPAPGAVPVQQVPDSAGMAVPGGTTSCLAWRWIWRPGRQDGHRCRPRLG